MNIIFNKSLQLNSQREAVDPLGQEKLKQQRDIVL